MRPKSKFGITALALVLVVASHLPYAFGWNPSLHFVYLPLPVIAICLVLVPQRHASWLIATSIVTFIASALTQGNWEGNLGQNWQAVSIDILCNVFAVAALGWAYGFRQSSDQRQAKGWRPLSKAGL